jgi:hypothetical protein
MRHGRRELALHESRCNERPESTIEHLRLINGWKREAKKKRKQTTLALPDPEAA